jgi:hypothetical protein
MQTVIDMLEAVQKIDFDKVVNSALIDSSETYTLLQRDQMLSGLREDGKRIFNIKTGSDEYSPRYAKFKGKKKPIDLHKTGDFSNALFMEVNDKTLLIDSKDEKSKKLQKRYGKEIFGLEDKRGSTFAEDVGNSMVNIVSSLLS